MKKYVNVPMVTSESEAMMTPPTSVIETSSCIQQNYLGAVCTVPENSTMCFLWYILEPQSSYIRTELSAVNSSVTGTIRSIIGVLSDRSAASESACSIAAAAAAAVSLLPATGLGCRRMHLYISVPSGVPATAAINRRYNCEVA
jgi:hypothetical protein